MIDLSFENDSWISKQSVGIKKVFRIINLILVKLIPLASAHFGCVVRKRKI